ncbi:PucR family transcriptional regulator [Streptomyces sp. NPDC015492]|uniref:PucR family transcriptional regulator n=1 Tax=Streptomyces sp. NPDC015492 TaxID=3364958 RepID=UPI0036F5395D
MTRHWLLRLRPPEDATTVPALPLAALVTATHVLGVEPVEWAVCTADAIAADIVEQVPAHGGGASSLATLRRSTESAVLATLLLLLPTAVRSVTALTEETHEGCREFARRAIPLEQVLRGVRLGHAHLADALAEAVEEHVRADDRLAEVRRVNELLFAYADTHASQMAETYIVERNRWRGSDEAARRAIVEDLLAGRDVEAEGATRRLRYDLARCHVAAVLHCDDPSATASPAERLHHAAVSLARAVEATGMLIVPAHTAGAWVWLAFPDETGWPGPGELRGRVMLPQGVRVALGPMAPGPAGMRRSHLGALAAERVAALGGGARFCDYREVRLTALATAQAEQADWFVRETLGRLASDGVWEQQLRETLRVYLGEGRSLRSAAQRLLVARNTVTYRVHRAEELLPAPLASTDLLELQMALEIADVLRGRAPDA